MTTGARRRRPARRIYVVHVMRFESLDAEEYEREFRFSNERAADVFARAVEASWGMDQVVTGPAPLYHSAKAALEDNA